jgi:hypothetical protein
MGVFDKKRKTFFSLDRSFYLYGVFTTNKNKRQMGFIDLFIEREEKKEETVSVNTPPSIQNVVPVINPSVLNSSSITQTVSVAQDDLQKFNQHFDGLFEQANLPGPDYFEFSKMCHAMATLPDEMKFPAVFGGLQVQGLTKQKLVESANHYISIIEEDAKKFNNAIDQKIVSEVQRKRSDAEQKRKSISDREDMIKKLQEEITNESIEITKLEAEATDQEIKAGQKATTYKAACETRKTMIASDVHKINSLIK